MSPRPGQVDVFAIVVALIAFLGMWRRKWDVLPVVLGGAAAGFLYYLIAG